MFRFRIVPADSTDHPRDFIAPDPSDILHFIQRMACKEVDIERAGRYLFSVRQDDNGLWCIFRQSR